MSGAAGGIAGNRVHFRAPGRSIRAAVRPGEENRVLPDPGIGPNQGYYRAKRGLDVVLVLLAAPVVLALLAVLAVAIRLESSGPAIYRQRRVAGRRVRTDSGWAWELRTFTFYKLRSMRPSDGPNPHERYIRAYIAGDEDEMARLAPDRAEGTYKMTADPRITRIGHVIRATSLDELPQLWNILKGDMSLVGPRPPIDYEIDRYRPEDLDRLAGPAGLTGAWQVHGRCELEFKEMVELDKDYLERRSFVNDLGILVKTVPAVVTRRGAG